MLFAWICAMVATLAINLVFVFSLLASLTWEERSMFLFATAALGGGLLFSIRTMTCINMTCIKK
jgi:hypothetical protein